MGMQMDIPNRKGGQVWRCRGPYLHIAPESDGTARHTAYVETLNLYNIFF